MNARTGFQAALVVIFMSSTASAAANFIPGHIHLHLERMAKASDVVALVRVNELSGSELEVHVERSFGSTALPTTMTVSSQGFAKADLEKGALLLVGFRRQARGTYQAVPKRYEVLVDGKIREYGAKAFLAATEAAASRVESIAKPSVVAAEGHVAQVTPEVL